MSKYAALRDHLSLRKQDRWIASFHEIEELLGFSLPRSARKYPAWWANQSDHGHSQCASWLEAGWQTLNVDLNAQNVTFFRFESPKEDKSTFKPSKAALDWADVVRDSVDKATLRVTFQWRRLGSVAIDSKGMIRFPRTPFGPTIYRFIVSDKNGEATYFGETEEIARRLQHYRTPGPTQRTNQWLNQHLRECIRAGGKVEVDVVSEVNLEQIDSVGKPDFSCKFTRRLLENAAIVLAQGSGCRVLNK